MKKLPLIFFFMLVYMSGVQAFAPAPVSFSPEGEGIIRGRVQDAQAEQDLEYASIALFSQTDSVMIDGCISSNDGSFSLSKIPNGVYYLSIQFIGYEKNIISDLIINRDNKLVDLGIIQLQLSSSNLETVEITSEKQSIQYNIDKKVINVSKDISSTGGTAVDALRNVPSVSVDAEGNVTIRGSANYTVLIDGRPVPQDGNDILKQTSASVIENIEVITNPSAKYDPDGTAGIINLVLKKNRQDGVNGIINASYGLINKYSTDFNLNIKTGKLNFFVGGEYRNTVTDIQMSIKKIWYSTDTAEHTESEVNQIYHPWNYKITGGFDYNINKSNSLSISGTYFRQDYDVESPVDYHIFSEPAENDEWKHYTNDFTLKHHWADVSAFYKHDFTKKGHSLSVNASFNRWKGEKGDAQQQWLTTENWSSLLNITQQRKRFYDNGSARISGDIDYVLPIGEKFKLETGYSVDHTTYESDYLVQQYDPDFNTWTDDSTLSSGFSYYYDVHALYGTFSGSIWKVDFQLGLRGEYFKRDLLVQNPETAYPMTIWSLFPSVHLSKNLKKGHSLGLSYSRRVNRPTVMALNPLPYFADDYLVHRGNPALKPEYANSYEFSWQKYFKESSISAEVYYRETQDKIVETISVQEGTTQLTNQNLARDWASGVEFMGNFSIGKLLKINTSLDGFTYHLVAKPGSGISNRSSWAANLSLNPALILKTGTVIQIQSMYATPSIDATGNMKGFFMLGAAIKQDFLKRSLSLSLSASNLFGLMQYHYTDVTSTYDHRFSYYPESNVLMLTLSYKINNYIRKGNHGQGHGVMDVGF